MQIFRSASPRQCDLALFIIRVASGLTMAAHGWQKVFVMGIGVMTGSFEKMGVPLPTATGPVISILELVGGVLLTIGFLTRPVAALLAIDMLVAAYIVHLPNGFFAPAGAELVLMLMAMYIALALAGGGSISVDAMLSKADRRST